MASKATKTFTFKKLDVETAKGLTHSTILYHTLNRNADGTPQRWRVSGKVKTWKRDQNRVEFTVKHGLYDNSRVTENDLELLAVSYTEN